MKKILLLFLFALVLVSSSNSSQCCFPQTKIVKQNNQRISLSSSNTWREFPELKATIELAESRLVHIGYVITMPSSPASHLVTRLIIDRTEDEYFRGITGNTVYHTNAISGFVFLSAGRHEVTVQYRTPGNMSISNGEDWTVAILQITY